MLARAAGSAQAVVSQHLTLAQARLKRWRDGLRALRGILRRELYTPGTRPSSKFLVVEF